MNLFEGLEGQLQVTQCQKVLPQVQLRVWKGSWIVAPLSYLGALAVEFEGALDIAEFAVKPSETIEESVVNRFVPNFLGQRQALLEQSQSLVIAAPARQGDSIEEKAEQQGNQEVVFPG